MLIDGITQLLSFRVTDSAPQGLEAYADQLQAVAAQVSGRVYENELPRGYKLPAVAVHQYGGQQDYDLSGPVGVVEDQIQLDVYGLDSASCRAAAVACRDLLQSFTGTLPDGTTVQAIYKERDAAMPFLPNADAKGIANRWTLGFRVISQR
jgi:hypothetical protein